MTPPQIVEFIESSGMDRATFAKRLRVTQAAISFWLQQGWLTFERQAHIQLEFPGSGLRAEWKDVPASKRKNGK